MLVKAEAHYDQNTSDSRIGDNCLFKFEIASAEKLDTQLKIFITGIAGFIGFNLAKRIVEHTDHTIIGVDKLGHASNSAAGDWLAAQDGCRFHPVDIGDVDAIQSIVKQQQPDAVLHLAAESHVDRSIDQPEDFITSNINGTFNLLRIFHDYWDQLNQSGSDKADRFRFINVSTDEVFGSLSAEDPIATETSPYQPNSPYAASKAAADHLVRAWYQTYGLPTISTHCSNNYGPWQFPEKLIPVVIMKAQRLQPIPIYGDGKNIRNWIHVDDHTRALLQVLENGVSGDTYNIAGENEIANLQLVDQVCDTLQELLPLKLDADSPRSPDGSIKHYRELITFVADRPGHDFRYSLNVDKITRDLNWSPNIDLRSGLKQTIAWYLENVDWCASTLSNHAYQLDRQGLKP